MRAVEEARGRARPPPRADAQALAPGCRRRRRGRARLASPEDGIMSDAARGDRASRWRRRRRSSKSSPRDAAVGARPGLRRRPRCARRRRGRASSARSGTCRDAGTAGARGSGPARRPIPSAATSDLFFAAANADGALRPGQRVEVELRLRQPEKARVVPWSAIVYDIDGGTWVYETTAPHVFVRRRVQVRRVEGDLAVLSGGPAPGAKVVSRGPRSCSARSSGTANDVPGSSARRCGSASSWWRWPPSSLVVGVRASPGGLGRLPRVRAAAGRDPDRGARPFDRGGREPGHACRSRTRSTAPPG